MFEFSLLCIGKMWLTMGFNLYNWYNRYIRFSVSLSLSFARFRPLIMTSVESKFKYNRKMPSVLVCVCNTHSVLFYIFYCKGWYGKFIYTGHQIQTRNWVPNNPTDLNFMFCPLERIQMGFISHASL